MSREENLMEEIEEKESRGMVEDGGEGEINGKKKRV